MEQASAFGIYLNRITKEVVRINSPYWIPDGPDWILLTPEVNSTLLQIRGLAGEKRLVPDADQLSWGTIPQRD